MYAMTLVYMVTHVFVSQHMKSCMYDRAYVHGKYVVDVAETQCDLRM